MSSKTQRLAKPSLVALISLLAVVYVLVPVSPANLPQPYTDSGVFLYTGWRILQGDVPYRDVWDHKPPAIFYLNAAGLAIGGGSRWGVWLLEAVSLAAAVILGFALLDGAFGTLPAILASAIWIGSLPFVLEGGNFTTEYAIPLQFGILYLAFVAEKRGWSWWRASLIGVLTAVSFLFKQTTIGATLAVVLFLLVTRCRRGQLRSLARELLFIAGGASAILALVAIGFARAGALDDLWDAAFRYNYLYADYVGSFKTTLKASVMGLHHMSLVGLSAFALGGWVAGAAYLHWRGISPKGLSNHLLMIGILDLPIELASTGLSGRGYGHYYMTLLPVLALLAGFFFRVFLDGVAALLGVTARPFHTAPSSLVVVGIAVLSQLPAFYQYRSITVKYKDPIDPGVVEYIRARTRPDDLVLVSGLAVALNFESRRASPTRFVYQDPLGMPGYTSVDLVEEFLTEVVENRPTLILGSIREFGFDSPGIREARKFIETRYQPVGQVGSWTMFRYMGDS